MGQKRKTFKSGRSCAKEERREAASDHDLHAQLEATILSLLSSRQAGILLLTQVDTLLESSWCCKVTQRQRLTGQLRLGEVLVGQRGYLRAYSLYENPRSVMPTILASHASCTRFNWTPGSPWSECRGVCRCLVSRIQQGPIV